MAASGKGQARLGVDIGGTFTDVALEAGERHSAGSDHPEAPERAVIAAVGTVREAGLAPGDLSIIIQHDVGDQRDH